MPYIAPAKRSLAASGHHPPKPSCRSYKSGQTPGRSIPSRPELPQPTSYVTQHCQSPSVVTTSFTPTLEPTQAGAAGKESNHGETLIASGNLQQSPPPMVDELQIPTKAEISPLDSTLNLSHYEDTKCSRGRQLENLGELQTAIGITGEQPESLPEWTGAQAEDQPTAINVEQSVSQGLRQIAHSRSNSDLSVIIGLRHAHSPEGPLTRSNEEDTTDEDETDRSRRKHPLPRKKSGELVKPALRLSSTGRRSLSMPCISTFSKAVHFDSHLEHVRHFFQVDRPLAVSAGSSPVEAYDSETETLFGDDESNNGHNPPFEWDIVLSNFPTESPQRLSLPVRVERVSLSSEDKTLIGSVVVANIAYEKVVIVRFTLDNWKTISEVAAAFTSDVGQLKRIDGYDRFNFNIELADQVALETKTMFFCVKYCVNGQEYWDNNNSANFQVDFRKRFKPQNCKKVIQGKSPRHVNLLRRSNKKSPPVTFRRPKSTPVAFDDFKRPVNECLDEPYTLPGLKGVKSASCLALETLTQRAPNPNGQALGSRYDFSITLSAAIQAANSARSDSSSTKSSTKKQSDNVLPDASNTASPILVTTLQDVNSAAAASNEKFPVVSPALPGASGTEKAVHASQLYNELLNKYCFVRTREF